MFKKNRLTFNTVLKKYFSNSDTTTSLTPLSELLKSIRDEDFEVFLKYLKDSPEITENFKLYIHRIFQRKSFNLLLTEANILSENSFFPEFKKRLLNKFLPPVENENTLWYLIDAISVSPQKDLHYFRNVHEEDLDEFFKLLEISDFIKEPFVKKEILLAINILIWRSVGSAMDAEIVSMVPNYRNLDNPFLALQNEVNVLNEHFKNNKNFQFISKDELYKQLKIYNEQCLEFVETAFKNATKYGISSKINQLLLKMRQQLLRISNMLLLLVIDEENEGIEKSKLFVFNVLEYKSHKNNLKELIDDSSVLLSHLITNHTAETGKNYIASGIKDYFMMFKKAIWGGAIVGILCVFKMFYSSVQGSEFLQAFLYSFNYASGFILIYLFHFTLATKQPAMTATTMAKVLSDDQNTHRNYKEFAHLVSKLFRTQFIAFVGNILMAFPIALAIIYSLDAAFEINYAANKADKLLKDLNPLESKAILHACIAGVFLFFSGVISGNVGNNSVYYNIPKRIEKNTLIISVFGQNFAQKLSAFYKKNWAGIVSNFWFGIFLGITGTVGKFLGLDLDIRHITFAAGNFALGLYGKDFSIPNSVFVICVVTIFLIGFFNFLVSFGLSMFLAFRSRKINFEELKQINAEIWKYFLSNPMKFFFPIRSHLDTRTNEMVEKTTTIKSEDR